jgi:hypothetical protein
MDNPQCIENLNQFRKVTIVNFSDSTIPVRIFPLSSLFFELILDFHHAFQPNLLQKVIQTRDDSLTHNHNLIMKKYRATEQAKMFIQFIELLDYGLLSLGILNCRVQSIGNVCEQACQEPFNVFHCVVEVCF